MGREGENMEFKALRMNVKNCFSMQLKIKLYWQWNIEIYFALQENRGEERWKKGVIEWMVNWGKE